MCLRVCVYIVPRTLLMWITNITDQVRLIQVQYHIKKKMINCIYNSPKNSVMYHMEGP